MVIWQRKIFSKGKFQKCLEMIIFKKWILTKKRILKLLPCNLSTKKLRAGVWQSLAKVANLVWRQLLIFMVPDLWNRVRSFNEYKRQKMTPDSSYSSRWEPEALIVKSNLTRSPGSLLHKCSPVAKTSPGSILEVQNLRRSLDLVEQNLHFNKIPWWLICTDSSRSTDLAAGSQDGSQPWFHMRNFRAYRDQVLLVSLIAG